MARAAPLSWTGLAAACAALAMLASDGARAQVSPAPSAALPGPALAAPEASLPLPDALAAVSAELAQLSQGGADYVIGSPQDAAVLGGYIPWMVAAHLEGRGLTVRRFDGALPVERGKLPESLPAALAEELRAAGGHLFVYAAPSIEQGQRYLTAAAYDIGNGSLRTAVRSPFHLPVQMEFLVSGERTRMDRRDADWLELFDAMFPEASSEAPSSLQPDLGLAEAGFFFDAGLWVNAAPLFLAAARDAPNRCFMRAVFALQLAGDPDRASLAARTALKRAPDSGPLYALQAWMSLRQKRPGDALLWLEQARLCGMATEGLYRYAGGLMALEQKDEARAEQELSAAADLLPEMLFAQLQMARLCRDRADLPRAVHYYRRACATAQAPADVWGEFAVALEAAGNADQAVEALRHAFGMQAGSLAVSRHLAALLKRKGKYKEALDVLRRAAEANPRKASLWAAYGDAAAEMWMTDLAEQAYQESLKADSEFPYGTVRLAALLGTEYRFSEARALLASLLANRPSYYPARVQLGWTLSRMGLTDQAISMLSEVLTQPEHEVSARLALVEVYLAAGRLPEALACAQIAASSRPDAQTCAALCDAFLTGHDVAEAESAAAMALEKEPGSPLAHLASARVLQAKGKPEEALAEAKRALELNPYSVDALDLLGSLSQALGDFQKCAEYWQLALARDPWHADLHRRLGDVLGPKLHDWTGTREHLTRYVELERARVAEPR